MQKKPWFILISGPNGAGKTTFHDRILKQNPFLKNAVFANSDNEYAKLVEMPENKAQFQELNTAIEKKTEEIKTKLLKRFTNLMEDVTGDLQTRIDKKTGPNKDYWQDQFSQSMHIQPEQEYVLKDLHTSQDLMRNVGGGDIHTRINAKSEKNNWYKLYKKVVYTFEVRKAIELYPLQQQMENLETGFQIDAGMITIKKIDNALKTGKNLIFESTGSGNKPRILVKNAKNKYGYSVYSFHPYLLRPELSIARVQHRVEQGGHNVPTDVILTRYDSSLNNLSTILSLVDIGIVMDNSGKKPYMPIFAQCYGHFTDFTQCPEYLQNARQTIAESFPYKPAAELLNLPQNMNISKITEEQREIFGQIIITNMLNMAVPMYETQKPYVSQELKQNISNGIQNILRELSDKNEPINDLHDIDYWGLCGKIINKYNIDISHDLSAIKTSEDLCNLVCEKIAMQDVR